MSSTSTSSRVMLTIPRRAQKRKIKKSILNILLAIDAVEGRARKSQLEEILGITLHHASVQLSESMGLVSHENIGCVHKMVFLYSLTRKGHALLEAILTGKEPA